MTVESAGSFFSQKSQTLVDALVEHGVHGDVARRVASGIRPGDALVTVTIDSDKHSPDEAIDILQRCGGRVEDGVASSNTGSVLKSQSGMSCAGYD